MLPLAVIELLRDLKLVIKNRDMYPIYTELLKKKGGQEFLDYFSVLLWLNENGENKIADIPESHMFKPMDTATNLKHNLSVFRKYGMLDRNLGEYLHMKSGQELYSSCGDVLPGKQDVRIGPVPPHLFMLSSQLDISRLEQLIDGNKYREDQSYNAFRSKWIYDGKMSYCLSMSKDLDIAFDLWYIVKKIGNGDEKYDIVVQFDSTGIVDVKHIEYEAINVRREKIEANYIKHPYTFISYCTTWFKQKEGEVEFRKVDSHHNVQHLHMPSDQKGDRVVLEKTIIAHPVMAGGAFKTILEYCLRNYSKLEKLHDYLIPARQAGTMQGNHVR